jgi:hypothetical protein
MNRHTLLLAVVLLYAAAFRFIALNRPFEYDLEAASNSQYGVLARNYLRFDLGQTQGIPVLTVSHLPNAPIVFYPDHPPLVPLFIVPFYALFGVGEWQTRLPTSMATVAATDVLYLLLTRFATRRIGLIAAAVFAATPMTLYFGGSADPVGMPLILFVLLSGIGYLHFHSRPGFLTLIPLVVAFVLAGLCGWPAYVIVPVFLAHFVATQPRRQWLWIIAFCLTACALFAATYVYIALATDSPWDWMVPLFNRRSPIGTNPFTLTQWLAAALAINGRYHTFPLLMASCIWLVMFGLRTRHAQSSATVALILMAWGILCVLIGGKAAYDHPYLWLPITPGVAIGAALLIERILRRAEHRGLANAANRIVVLFLVLFASWTWYTTFREFYPLKQDRPFTPMELGQAIQAAAPDPSDLVLLVGGEEAEPQLWFYGDRPLRIRVWSIEQFKRRLHDETADLMYDFNVQPWRAAGAGIVFPAVYRRDFGNFWAYLQQHYSLVPLPTALADKFDVFDLRDPLAGAP